MKFTHSGNNLESLCQTYYNPRAIYTEMKSIQTLFAALLFSAVVLRSPAEITNTPALKPVTVYGGDYRVLPGAASVNVIGAEQIVNTPLATTRDLAAVVPGTIVFDGNNGRLPKFSVRGLRENNFVTGDPAVGVYLDDIPFNDLYTRTFPLHGVDSVEFLRGPQGTLYGASAPGGVINLVSQQPGDEFRGQAGVTYGNYNQRAVTVSSSGPILTNVLAFGVSGLWGDRDGFVDNSFTGKHPDDQRTLSGRAQLRWTPCELWDVTLTAGAHRFDDGFVPTYNPSSDAGYFDVTRDDEGFVDTEAWYLGLRATYHGDGFKATSATSYRHWKQDLAQDFDFSATAPATIGFFNPVVEQFAEEVRFRSLDDDARWKWNAGGYLAAGQTETDSGRTIDIFPPMFVDSSTTHAEQEAETYAAFGETTYSFDEKWDVTAGLRLTLDQREMDRSRSGVDVIGQTGPFLIGPTHVENDYSAVQPKFALAYHFQPDCVGYVSAANGYQSGGFNASNDNPADQDFDPARSWHYELGARSVCMNSRVQWSFALFYTETDDYQVYRLNPLNPAQAYIVNADSAWSAGVESELSWRASDRWTLTLNGGYTHAEFDNFTDPVSGGNFDGNDINFVPEFTLSLGAEYRFSEHLYARVEVVSVGSYQLDEANTASDNGYTLLNAKLGYNWKQFELTLWGRNLLNEEYAANALDFRSAFTPNLLVRQPGDPLLFGATLSATF
jgi:iron complex outermembrane receptor protein